MIGGPMILTACGRGDCYKEQLVLVQVDNFIWD